MLFVSGEERTPQLTGAWNAHVESNHWFTARNSSNDNWFHLWEAIDGSTINYPSRSLFLVTGEQKLVRDLYLYASSSGYDVWTLNGLRNDNSVKATIIKNAWTIKEENVGIKHTMAGFDYSSTTEQTITFNDLDE